MALRRGVDAPLPLAAHHPRHRHRHHHGGHGGVAADRPARGVVTFFQELGPDNIFVYKTSAATRAGRAAPPKERKRRADRSPSTPTSSAAGARYRGGRRRCSSSSRRCVDGKPITARVPGFEIGHLSIVGPSPNMRRDLAARFRRRAASSRRRRTSAARTWR